MSLVKMAIKARKKELSKIAKIPLSKLARSASDIWSDPDLLDQLLRADMSSLENCDLLYAFDPNGYLVSSNIEKEKTDVSMRGHSFQGRPYFENNLPYKGILLSRVYVSRYNGRSCITILQAVRDDNRVIGFIAADFDLDGLPTPETEEINRWSQYKGDPAIRGTLFMQERIESEMDRHLDKTMEAIQEVMVDYGVFHMKIHFSSSRVSFWRMDDPFDYLIHTVASIIDPEFKFTFKRQTCPTKAIATVEDIDRVLSMLKQLRYADETIYLRSASFNIINGLVGLTFSCDGSHYMHFEEFLSRSISFWLGDRAA
ncbi:MAG: PDC sensor domain-containing protein [Gammaproteobacteria bacterium]|nr:PDC sensor domain-containing protein [Gammaproteobacteria bacterium]